MDYFRILVCLQALGIGFAFQFSSMDGSVQEVQDLQLDPNPTEDNEEVQFRQATITPTLVTCTCVPPGSCPVTPTLPTDGSGQIDIRIVNNVRNLFNGSNCILII